MELPHLLQTNIAFTLSDIGGEILKFTKKIGLLTIVVIVIVISAYLVGRIGMDFNY